MIGGLAAAVGVDAVVVAHQGAGVVAEAFGYFVDAVAGVEQAGGEQVADLVRADRADTAAVASWLNRLVTMSGRSGWPVRPVNM